MSPIGGADVGSWHEAAFATSARTSAIGGKADVNNKTSRVRRAFSIRGKHKGQTLRLSGQVGIRAAVDRKTSRCPTKL